MRTIITIVSSTANNIKTIRDLERAKRDLAEEKRRCGTPDESDRRIFASVEEGIQLAEINLGVRELF